MESYEYIHEYILIHVRIHEYIHEYGVERRIHDCASNDKYAYS